MSKYLLASRKIDNSYIRVQTQSPYTSMWIFTVDSLSENPTSKINSSNMYQNPADACIPYGRYLVFVDAAFTSAYTLKYGNFPDISTTIEITRGVAYQGLIIKYYDIENLGGYSFRLIPTQ